MASNRKKYSESEKGKGIQSVVDSPRGPKLMDSAIRAQSGVSVDPVARDLDQIDIADGTLGEGEDGRCREGEEGGVSPASATNGLPVENDRIDRSVRPTRKARRSIPFRYCRDGSIEQLPDLPSELCRPSIVEGQNWGDVIPTTSTRESVRLLLEELGPDLSMAVNLEELITQGCKRLKRIPESISNLTRLTKIDVSYCDDLNSYHITIRELTGRCRQIALYFSGGEIEMESIENLSIGENIHILWLDGKADHLCFSTEQKAPDELTKREQQQAPYDKQMYRGLGLPMSEPHGLEWMMQRDRRVPHVHTMPKLHDYESMKKAERKSRATSEFHGFNSIEIIRFNYKSDGASFFCCSLSMFPCLKELNLINLNIQVIPDDVCALKSLEKLDWSGNDFETLPETMNQLPRLKHVSL